MQITLHPKQINRGNINKGRFILLQNTVKSTDGAESQRVHPKLETFFFLSVSG